MAVIHVVTWANRAKYRIELERYFRIRYDIYVKRRQWRALARPVNIEMDAFDTEHAVYLLAINSIGKIVGGVTFHLNPGTAAQHFQHVTPAGNLIIGS